MTKNPYNESVFINCPFDKNYKPILNSIIFTIFDCGFTPRCALEEDDASNIRIDKIYKMISSCRYGIHDLSRVELDSKHKLPRFNMPLELGIFLGSKMFGENKHKKKACLILDIKKYRYQKFISDISGQDVKAHNNKEEKVTKIVRDWLRGKSTRTPPGGKVIYQRYIRRFRQWKV